MRHEWNRVWRRYFARVGGGSQVLGNTFACTHKSTLL
jgi:hypothetical protein